MEQQSNKHPGTWVVVFANTQRFIGRVHDLDFAGLETSSIGRRAVVESRIITLNPCFDYLMPMIPRSVQGAAGQMVTVMTREPIVTAFDMTHVPTEVHIRNWDVVAFLDDMCEEDRLNYKAAIGNAIKQAEADFERQKAHNAGIELVGPDGRPKNNVTPFNARR